MGKKITGDRLVTVNFNGLLGWAMVLKYMVKYYFGCFCEGGFGCY